MKLSSRQLLAIALLARGYSRVGKTRLTLMNAHLPWHFRISAGHRNLVMGAQDVWVTDRGHLRIGDTFTASRSVPRVMRAILRTEGQTEYEQRAAVSSLLELGL